MAKINPIQLQKHLKGVDYPASKQDLVKAAEENGADEDVRSMLGQLPDEEYQTPADVSKAVGKVDEGEGGEDDRHDDRGRDRNRNDDHARGSDRDDRDGDRKRGDDHDRDSDRGRDDGREGRINPIQLQKYLKGVNYPASRQDLIKAAEENGADKNVCAALGQLPDEEYNKPTDVSEALGALEDGGDGDHRDHTRKRDGKDNKKDDR